MITEGMATLLIIAPVVIILWAGACYIVALFLTGAYESVTRILRIRKGRRNDNR